MIRLLENHQLGYVTHAFVSCKSDELELLPNEVIVFSKENTGGWTYGFYMGRTGWLPLSYVQNIDENFLSKKSSTTYLNRSSPDSYDYSIQSLTRNEKDFIKDFKQKFGTICTDFTSKTLCSKIDSSLILMLCERFIRIYENFTGLLEKEANKSIEKQMIGRLYMNLNAVLFNFILNYCQFHSYFIQTILQNKTVINSAKQSNEIQSNLMSFITFFSSPFLRMNSISLLLKEIGEKLEKSSLRYLELKISICQLQFLHNGGAEVRRIYLFMAELFSTVKEHVSDMHNNLQELSQTLIHHISVHPSSVSFEEDCKFYFLIFNNKKLLYGYLQSASNPQTFKLIDIFIVKNTKLESIADRENLFNLIDVSDSESNKKLELVTEGSNEKKFILDLFQKIKEGKNYLPFWFDKKIVLLTIPSIPIQRTIMRVTNRNQNSIGNEENRINYKLLASILSNTMGVPRHSLIRTESKQMEELNFLTERVRKLEELVNEMNRKLEHNVRKGNNLEEIIKRLIKLPK